MIEVFDNFLDDNEIEELYDVLWNADWYLKGTDYSLSNRNDRGWSLTKYSILEDKSSEIYHKILQKISSHPLINNRYQCARTLRNAYKYGDVLGLHKDEGFDITAMVYGNREWNLNWGSETIFAEEERQDAEIIKSVIPKPGRLVIFDSLIPHTGRVPSSLFPNYRYSVVYNFVLNR